MVVPIVVAITIAITLLYGLRAMLAGLMRSRQRVTIGFTQTLQAGQKTLICTALNDNLPSKFLVVLGITPMDFKEFWAHHVIESLGPIGWQTPASLAMLHDDRSGQHGLILPLPASATGLFWPVATMDGNSVAHGPEGHVLEPDTYRYRLLLHVHGVDVRNVEREFVVGVDHLDWVELIGG